MLTDKEYTERYMDGLARRGVRNVPESQALKDRALWPHLAPADAAAQRADEMWENDLDDENIEPVAQPGPTPPTPGPATAPAVPPVNPQGAPAPRAARQKPILAVVRVETYEVNGKTFTDAIEAVKFAYLTAMEEALGVPLDIDVLAASAVRIQELTADYLTRTRKDDD